MKYNVLMIKAYVFLVLGVWVAILPHLGFPYFWKDVLTTISGIGLIYISFVLYKEYKTKETKKGETFDNFSENKFEAEEKM